MPGEDTELLRQILTVQKQQLAFLQANAAAHDVGTRWRAFVSRWQQDFPDLPEICKHAVPMLERSYSTLLTDLGEQLSQEGAIDNEFALEQVLDRFGIRLGQLGTLLNIVASLAEATKPSEAMPG